MKTRKLGSSELDLTVVGLGAWAIGGPWEHGWSFQDDDASVDTIKKAIDLGINWIDTAAIYGFGHSEKIVAKALGGERQNLIVATKCGLIWDDNKQIQRKLSKKTVREECENSLRRLNTDYIDFYQIHWPTTNDEIMDAMEELARLVEEGKVRYLGVSNFTSDNMRAAMKIHPIVSHQPKYNMMHAEIEKDELPFSGENKIGNVVYGPLNHGLLTGKYDKEKVLALPDDDWRHNNTDYKEPALSINMEFIEKLQALASDANVKMTDLAISWVLRKPEVTSAIVGMRKPAHAEKAISGASFEMSDDLLYKINDLLAERLEKLPKK